MKTKINLKLIWLFAGLGIVALIVIVYAAMEEKYRADPGEIRVTARDGSGDWSITNTSSKSYFIPNKTSLEWTSFKNACTSGSLTGLSCTPAGGGPGPGPVCIPGLQAVCRCDSFACNCANAPAENSWCNDVCKNTYNCSGGWLSSDLGCHPVASWCPGGGTFSCCDSSVSYRTIVCNCF